MEDTSTTARVHLSLKIKNGAETTSAIVLKCNIIFNVQRTEFIFSHSVKRQTLQDYLDLEFLSGTKEHVRIRSCTERVGVPEKTKIYIYIYIDHYKM